jgi:acid stress-induced BolA-like protein IbaG/YrbA
MTADEVKILIEKGLPGAVVTVAGDGGKFEATVVSAAFEGLSMLKEHQLVFGTVRSEIASGAVHALTIKAYTPEEWAALKC